MNSGNSGWAMGWACLTTAILTAVIFTLVGIGLQARFEIVQPRTNQQPVEPEYDFVRPGPLPFKSE